MANALAIRVKFRKYTAEQLQNVIDNEESNETEVKVAQELLDKLQKDAPVEAKEKPAAPAKKPAPKKAAQVEEDEAPAEAEDKTPEAAAKRQNKKTTEYVSENELTPAEKKRLDKAEAEFDERQKNRKTPSKSDKGMKEKPAAPKADRATKRENLDESNEVPGLRVGSKVTLKGKTEVGEITRVYVSSDGKEKCMVKIGDGKAIKKRVTAVELVEEEAPKTKAAPKKAKK